MEFHCVKKGWHHQLVMPVAWILDTYYPEQWLSGVHQSQLVYLQGLVVSAISCDSIFPGAKK
jgi:hypothetical protein